MLQDLSLSGLVALLISAAVLMASPGPTTMSITATAAAFGFRRSLGYCAGINLGTILVLLAVANPKAYLAIGAVYAQSTLLAERPLSDALLKCILLAMAIIAIHTLWALAGSSLTRVLRHPTTSRLVNLALAATLVLLVLAEFL